MQNRSWRSVAFLALTPRESRIRWKRWKRAFNLYVASKGVTNEGQKVTLLLHSGGIELQEIYYTLVSEDQDTSFNVCVAVLDNYFTPKVNVPFERHVFRQMQKMEGGNYRSICVPSAPEGYIL